MKPVFQTRFSATDGNCFAACIASLLEISIEEAEPTAAYDEDQAHWFERCSNFLKERGYFLFEIKVDFGNPNWVFPFYQMNSGGYCIASGPSPRGNCHHAVIGQIQSRLLNPKEFEVKVELVHNPFPRCSEYLKSIDTISFLIPFDPSVMTINPKDPTK